MFVCEQILYSPADMKRHMSRGDVEGPLAEGGFKGHPICEFCRSRFFSESELFQHNTERHETCFICRQENPHIYRYFRDYTSLEGHTFSECQFLKNTNFQNFYFRAFSIEPFSMYTS